MARWRELGWGVYFFIFLGGVIETSGGWSPPFWQGAFVKHFPLCCLTLMIHQITIMIDRWMDGWKRSRTCRLSNLQPPHLLISCLARTVSWTGRLFKPSTRLYVWVWWRGRLWKEENGTEQSGQGAWWRGVTPQQDGIGCYATGNQSYLYTGPLVPLFPPQAPLLLIRIAGFKDLDCVCCWWKLLSKFLSIFDKIRAFWSVD